MKWTLVVLGSLVSLVLVIVVVGLILPQSHVASRRARFKRSAASLFPVLTDFGAFPTWRPGVTKVEMLAPREAKTSFRETGTQGALTFVVEEVTPPKRLVTRVVDNSAFGGTWTFELVDQGDDCEVAITERGEVYNPVFRVMSRLFFSQTATLEGYLRALGTKMGEQVEPHA